MRSFKFTIQGRPGEPEANPVPKLKMTGRQFWTPQAQAYVRWKDWVVTSFLRSLENDKIAVEYGLRYESGDKPFAPFREKAYMAVWACYGNRKHPDTENVFGSIADALFQNDNCLAGEFDFIVDPRFAGRVNVLIEIPDYEQHMAAGVPQTIQRKANRDHAGRGVPLRGAGRGGHPAARGDNPAGKPARPTAAPGSKRGGG